MNLLFFRQRQVSSSGSERSLSVRSIDVPTVSQAKTKKRNLKLKTPKIFKNVTKNLSSHSKSLSLNDISDPIGAPQVLGQVPKEDSNVPIVPKRVKKTDSDAFVKVPQQSKFRSLRQVSSQDIPENTEEKKKKPLLSRAVHKSVKRIKSVDLTGLTSLKNNQKLRKSVKNETIGYNVSNSVFFQTPEDHLNGTPYEYEQDENTVNEGTIEEENLSSDIEDCDDISDNQTLVHEQNNTADDDLIENIEQELEQNEIKIEEIEARIEQNTPEVVQASPKIKQISPKVEQNSPKIKKISSKIEQNCPQIESEIEDTFTDPEDHFVQDKPKESDSESTTTFYSVQSDLEDEIGTGKRHVKFGSSLDLTQESIGQVSHQHLFFKNWPLGGAVKQI